MSKTTYVPVVNEGTVESYRMADSSGKAKIRTALKSAMMSAVEEMDGERANDYRVTLAACTANSKPEKAAVDYAAEVAQQIVDLRAAAAYLESGVYLPKGITADMLAASPTDLAEVDFDEIEVSDTAVVLATAKITRSADRNSIQAAIERAFEGLPAGTFLTGAEMSNRGALGEYKPSSGAILARLFPRSGNDCTLVGFTPAYGPKGQQGATNDEGDE